MRQLIAPGSIDMRGNTSSHPDRRAIPRARPNELNGDWLSDPAIANLRFRDQASATRRAHESRWPCL